MNTDRPVAAPATFSLNFEAAVRAIFKDSNWLKKLALGALFSFLGLFIVGSIIVQGYLLAYGERVARAEPYPLPEWEEYGELLRKGLLGFIVAFVYALPLALVGLLLALITIPLIIAASASGASSDAVGGLATLAVCGGFALFLPLLFLVIMIVPAAHAQLILHHHDLRAAFRVGEVFRLIRRHLGQYLLMTALVFVASAFLSQIGQFACFVGIFATTFIAQLFQYHLLGQLCWYERAILGTAPQQPALP